MNTQYTDSRPHNKRVYWVYSGKSYYCGTLSDLVGSWLCAVGFHKGRVRKNGKYTEVVCQRRYCEYAKKNRRCI